MISQDYGEVGSRDFENWRFIGSANYGQDDANACVVQTGFKPRPQAYCFYHPTDGPRPPSSSRPFPLSTLYVER